jgi:hypothetical protein
MTFPGPTVFTRRSGDGLARPRLAREAMLAALLWREDGQRLSESDRKSFPDQYGATLG